MSSLPDMLIALAYCGVPVVLIHLARRRSDLRFNGLWISFGVFALASGARHALIAWNDPAGFWLGDVFRIVAAVAAVTTALLLWRALPGILSLPSQTQLHQANESLARANRELEAFTASVSHDLRSPLTTIAGQAGLLELSLSENVTDDQRRRLNRIESGVKQMSELIDALLVLSRISRHTLHREMLDLSTMADQVIADLCLKHPERDVRVNIQPGMTVHGDRRLIADMLTNLLANAWKFTSKTADPLIEMGQSQAGTMATLYVRDNGAGFNMAYEQKLFKPFQRLHRVDEFEGTGVGLATVARIIERHGGRIWAEGKLQGGAAFHFTLPAVPISEAVMLGREAVA
jgi:light-regulated signal transduction histidine kinase (bacteriophytochrome)